MKTLIYFNNYMYHKYQQCPYLLYMLWDYWWS